MQASIRSAGPTLIDENDGKKGQASEFWAAECEEKVALGEFLMSKTFDDGTIKIAQRGYALFLRDKICYVTGVTQRINGATFDIDYSTLNKAGIIQKISTREKFSFVEGQGVWRATKDDVMFGFRRFVSSSAHYLRYQGCSRAVKYIDGDAFINGVIIYAQNHYARLATVAVWTSTCCVDVPFQNLHTPEIHISANSNLEKRFGDWLAEESDRVLEVPKNTNMNEFKKIVFQQNRLLVSYPLEHDLPSSVVVIWAPQSSCIPTEKNGYRYVTVDDAAV